MASVVKRMFDEITTQIEESISVKETMLNHNIIDIQNIAKAIIKCYENGGKVITMGNGGSAADAQHFVAELSGRFMKDREPLPAICLNTNVSTITAIANDYGYDEIFKRQIDAVAEPGDVVIGISTSGNSKNINRALQRAIDTECITIGIGGKGGGIMNNVSEYKFTVMSSNTPRVQEAHITAIHIICGLVEQALFPD